MVSAKTFSVEGVQHFEQEILEFNSFRMPACLCSICIFVNNACTVGEISKGLVKDLKKAIGLYTL